MTRLTTAAVAAATLLVSMLAAPALAAPPATDAAAAPAATTSAAAGVVVDNDGDATGLWIVQLAEPALASYAGGTPGLAPTSPGVTGAPALDVTAPASVAYLDHLAARHIDVWEQIQRTLGRAVQVGYSYRNVVNALAVRVSAAEARQLTALSEVVAVHRDVARPVQTDVSADLIGSPSIWHGATGTGMATGGEGVIVGVIDTGINPDHPSFASTDGDGYTHRNPFGAGTYVGVCDPAHPEYDDMCNDKLIGAWNFHPLSPHARDVNGHGSHTASTAAGNRHEATVTIGNDSFTRTVQGVAPQANIISYLVCYPTCPLTSSVAAVNQAIEDGVDVLNFSIGGGDNPWSDIVDLAFLDAYNAGIFVAASAGNDGPGPSTVAKTGPWNASVAATTTPRVFANRMTVSASVPVPPELDQIWAVPGTGPKLPAALASPVRLHPDNLAGCQAFPADFFADSAALVARGGCEFSAKVTNAAAAGANLVLVAHHEAGPPIPMAQLAQTGVPAFMIDRSAGTALREFLQATTEPVTIHMQASTELAEDPQWAGVVAGFSSRGPSQFDLAAPTFGAPGVNVLAAGADGATSYEIMQGTSMASPHAAGAGALLAALHPDWSPAQIRSALAGTAVTDGLYKPDGATLADPLDVGAGRVDVARAGRVGIVLDETYANFMAANPAHGGDPRQLNVPGLIDRNCAGECTWTRLLTSVATGPAHYTAQVDAPDGVTVTVTPSTFTLAAGATQQVQVTAQVDGSDTPVGQWAFGTVAFDTDAAHPDGPAIASVAYPLAVVAMPPAPQQPQITVTPDDVAATLVAGQSEQHTVTIGNEGTTDLRWHVHQSEQQQPRTLVDSLSRTITHSASQEVVNGMSVACSPDQGVTTSENAYLRTFRLDEFDITDRFDVVEVEFGVERLADTTELTVALYTMVDPDAAVTYANLTEIGRASQVVAGQTLSHVAVPVTGHVPAGATLVVEVHAPDLSGAGGFWPGSNSAGQTSAGYLRAPGCGLSEPVDLATLGFADMHLVMNVTGLTEAPQCDVPAGVPWAQLSSDSGTVAAGDEQQVQLSVDAADLAAGDYQGNLCLASDDPVRPLLAVPVLLTVQEPPEIHLDTQVWFTRGSYQAHLTWSGQESTHMDVYRDGELIATVPAEVPHTDDLGLPRARVTEYEYQVCQAGEQICSPASTAVIDRLAPPPHPPWHPHPRPSLQINTDALPDLHVLEQYEAGLTASGGSGVYTWTATGLPAGLVLHEGTGLITNDPHAPAIVDGAPTTVTVTATDVADPTLTATASVELSVVGVAQLAAGWGHTCAVTTEQGAYCWGRNATGQIGNGEVGGDGVHVPLPTPVLHSDGSGPLTGVIKIAGGDGHTCALTEDGTAYCWGASFDGRLGYGDPHVEPQPLPQQVRNPDDTGPLSGIVDITVGSQFACAVTEAGSAYCWGNNASGKLGTGEVGGRQPLPTPVVGPDGAQPLAGVTGVVAGGSHACAWGPEAMYCWGNNNEGQLGNAQTSPPVPHAVAVADGRDGHALSDVTAGAAGAGHTCAVTEAGDTYCWGRNSTGQVGHGTAGPGEPVPVRVRDPHDDTALVAITHLAAGDNHTCAVDADGHAYCWGSNFYAQLGDPRQSGADSSALPVPVHGHDGVELFTDVVVVAAGDGHSCLLTGAGTVSCWGTNFNRQLGIGDTTDQHRQVLPAPVHPGR